MESALLSQLHEEFTTNKALLSATVNGNREVLQHVTNIKARFPIHASEIDDIVLSDIQTNSIIEAIRNRNSFSLLTDHELRKEVLRWNARLEDYKEDELRNLKHSLDQVQPYLTAKSVYTDMGLLDERSDFSFLGTL